MVGYASKDLDNLAIGECIMSVYLNGNCRVGGLAVQSCGHVQEIKEVQFGLHLPQKSRRERIRDVGPPTNEQ